MALLVIVIVLYLERGIDPRAWIKWTFADESKGLRKALEQILPSCTVHHLDLRHQVATCKRLHANHGGKAWGEYLAGTVQFVAPLPSKRLVSLYIEHVLAQCCVEGGAACADFARREVFLFDVASGSWGAEWYCGVQSGKPPGVTSDTVSQARESTWDAVKGAISCSIAHKDITVATAKVEAAIVAVWIRREWLHCPVGTTQWQLKRGSHGFSWPVTHAAWPSRRLISGAPQQTERFVFEGDMQRTVHCVDNIRAALVNFGACTLKQSVLWSRSLRFYMVHYLMMCLLGYVSHAFVFGVHAQCGRHFFADVCVLLLVCCMLHVACCALRGRIAVAQLTKCA